MEGLKDSLIQQTTIIIIIANICWVHAMCQSLFSGLPGLFISIFLTVLWRSCHSHNCFIGEEARQKSFMGPQATYSVNVWARVHIQTAQLQFWDPGSVMFPEPCWAPGTEHKQEQTWSWPSYNMLLCTREVKWIFWGHTDIQGWRFGQKSLSPKPHFIEYLHTTQIFPCFGSGCKTLRISYILLYSAVCTLPFHLLLHLSSSCLFHFILPFLTKCNQSKPQESCIELLRVRGGMSGPCPFSITLGTLEYTNIFQWAQPWNLSVRCGGSRGNLSEGSSSQWSGLAPSTLTSSELSLLFQRLILCHSVTHSLIWHLLYQTNPDIEWWASHWGWWWRWWWSLKKPIF